MGAACQGKADPNRASFLSSWLGSHGATTPNPVRDGLTVSYTNKQGEPATHHFTNERDLDISSVVVIPSDGASSVPPDAGPNYSKGLVHPDSANSDPDAYTNHYLCNTFGDSAAPADCFNHSSVFMLASLPHTSPSSTPTPSTVLGNYPVNTTGSGPTPPPTTPPSIQDLKITTSNCTSTTCDVTMSWKPVSGYSISWVLYALNSGLHVPSNAKGSTASDSVTFSGLSRVSARQYGVNLVLYKTGSEPVYGPVGAGLFPVESNQSLGLADAPGDVQISFPKANGVCSLALSWYQVGDASSIRVNLTPHGGAMLLNKTVNAQPGENKVTIPGEAAWCAAKDVSMRIYPSNNAYGLVYYKWGINIGS